MTIQAPRRALWISDYFPRPHDMTAGTWALESVVALQAAGLPVVVVAPTPWIPRQLAVTATLREWSRVPAQLEIKGVPVFYPRLPHYPRRWVIEHFYNPVPFLESSFLWPWIRGAVDRVMRTHPFDLVHTNFLFPSGYLGLELKHRYGTPLIVHERSVQRLAAARAHPARREMYRRILRGADVVITENWTMAGELREMEPAIAELRVFMQPGAYPDSRAALAQPRPAAYQGRRIVLSVGTLSERKGHEYLIRAVAELRSEFPDLVCRIIGEGPERPRLQALILDLALQDCVELCGRAPHVEVLGAMSWCDIFALPSWGEAGGTVYGEAMQFGKPIIACIGEGITEHVCDGVHGLLVPPRDVTALASVLRQLLSAPEARERMGAAARALAVARLSYSKLAGELIALYTSLSRRAARSQPDLVAAGRADSGPVAPGPVDPASPDAEREPNAGEP